MKGNIRGISGPTVRTDLKGLKLYERVFVGKDMLTGEVVRLGRDNSVIQVYEDTRGLSAGEPIEGTGMPLTVSLGPGLLSGMFDGLQRPLARLRDEAGPFMAKGKELEALERTKRWSFTPMKRRGDFLEEGEEIGFVQEGPFRHFIISAKKGKIAVLREGHYTAAESPGRFEDGAEISLSLEWPVRNERPYKTKYAPREPLVTGQRSIDFLFPLAKGGTAVFPGGFGTGKTILEQSVAKFADVDIVVYVGCGERGNEMAEMIQEFESLTDPWTGRRLMDRTLLIVNTSNMPVAAREASIYTAVSMAEYYRDMGYNVLFLADSLSRWAEALREISSSLEEMPGEEGYPTYLASRLSGFLERAGVVETFSGKTGSLSMILSVSPPGGDFTEPVTQACLRTAGSFLMLDTALAHSRHFPAINWFQSYSLYAKDLAGHFGRKVDPQWEALVCDCKSLLQEEQSLREVAEIVGSEGLQDSDRLLMKTAERIRYEFLSQNAYSEDAFSPPEKTFESIKGLIDQYRADGEELNRALPEDMSGAADPSTGEEAARS